MDDKLEQFDERLTGKVVILASVGILLLATCNHAMLRSTDDMLSRRLVSWVPMAVMLFWSLLFPFSTPRAGWAALTVRAQVTVHAIIATVGWARQYHRSHPCWEVVVPFGCVMVIGAHLNALAICLGRVNYWKAARFTLLFSGTCQLVRVLAQYALIGDAAGFPPNDQTRADALEFALAQMLPGVILSPATRHSLSRLFRMDAAHVVQLTEGRWRVAIMQTSVRPLSLRFHDLEQEREYSVWRFRESGPLTINMCIMYACLHGIRAIVFPARMLGCLLHVVSATIVVVIRVLAFHHPDQHRASKIFAWSWCAVYVLAAMGYCILQHTVMYKYGVIDTASLSFIMLMATLMVLALRIVFAVPLAPRLVGLALSSSITVAVDFLLPATSLSRSWCSSSLVQVGVHALVISLGEGAGAPFEWYKRSAFLQQHSSASGGASDAEAMLHPWTLSLTDVEKERAYRVRRFTASYSLARWVLAVVFCINLLSGLADVSQRTHGRHASR